LRGWNTNKTMTRDYEVDLVVHRYRDVNGYLSFESSSKHIRVFAKDKDEAIYLACFQAKDHERHLWNRVRVEVINVE
jgi:hypothetical protein